MLTSVSHFRYERKYLTREYGHHQLEQQLLLQPAFFKPIYHQRKVISIYFDTPELDYYYLNVLGAFERKKVRVRWYEHDGHFSDLQIEVKIKAGELIKKLTIPIKKTISELFSDFSSDFPQIELTQIVQNQLQNSLVEAVNIRPVMVNSYQRKYFFSQSTGMRVTIDSDLRFQLAAVWRQRQTEQKLDATILECKYSVQDDPRLTKIAQGLPLIVTKSSKYILGMQTCYQH